VDDLSSAKSLPSSSLRYRLTKAQKLRRPSEFKRVYDGGAKAGDDRLLVFALPNDLGLTRLGLSVSKKHGGAVKRNRIKRLLREAFRLSQHDLPPGLDLVLIPRPNAAATFAEYRTSLAGCARRAAKRLPPRLSDEQSRDRQGAVQCPGQREPLPDGRGSEAVP
jgi:ribonuclease P protein component